MCVVGRKVYRVGHLDLGNVRGSLLNQQRNWALFDGSDQSLRDP